MVDHFETPLKTAGVDCSAPDIIDQWHELIKYAKETLDIHSNVYMKTWRKIFSSPRCKNWSAALTLIELLFTLPISNAKLERIFSKLKRVVTADRASLKGRLEDILRIMEEGLSWEVYNPVGAISLWWEDVSRRMTEEIAPTGL